jgi:putative hemolysin
MPYQAAALIVGSLLVAVPSTAADNSTSNTVAPKTQVAAKNQTYCLQFGVDTGSRIKRLDCKTKKEWAQLGVDVDEVVGK